MLTYRKKNSEVSRRTFAGRCASRVRKANAWKIRAGLLTPRELRQWAREVERDALARPEEFQGWAWCYCTEE